MNLGGLLHPVPMSSTFWQDINLDFVEGMPSLSMHTLFRLGIHTRLSR